MRSGLAAGTSSIQCPAWLRAVVSSTLWSIFRSVLNKAVQPTSWGEVDVALDSAIHRSTEAARTRSFAAT